MGRLGWTGSSASDRETTSDVGVIVLDRADPASCRRNLERRFTTVSGLRGTLRAIPRPARVRSAPHAVSQNDQGWITRRGIPPGPEGDGNWKRASVRYRPGKPSCLE